MSVLSGKNILLGISGGIAAYKIPFLIRLLVKKNANVKCVITNSARDFITPLTISALSNNPVYENFTTNEVNKPLWNNHVELANWADLMIIAPATSNLLSLLSSGECKNLLVASYLSCKCDIYIAPAMDLEMFNHPSNKDNINKLKKIGNHILPSPKGPLASGLNGKGRMLEPSDIVKKIEKKILSMLPMRNLKVLITAGPTHEYIDPVRFISNGSSGLMGFELAKTCLGLGAKVILITGPTHLKLEDERLELIDITSAMEMYNEVISKYKKVDIIICAAAVADYTPKKILDKKIKKESIFKNIVFKKTVDILKYLGENKKNQLIIGFALETDNEIENAIKKIKNKNLDAIVLNKFSSKNKCFQSKKNEIIYIEKNKDPIFHKLKDKKLVSVDIINYILKLYESNN
ncbi:MAG: bifunctional phosphopantothenoylcysteine decarboxylase/phosphopantothenate--cysteine ligase CoaBC [Flavobacteriaceae bacterium]|nr:bifunctional phosphopantothenoylcysteine decarboxylase/phosphopantothenate--cysteine ligase CoaBC [Flavobacteriaceae bacterium]